MTSEKSQENLATVLYGMYDAPNNCFFGIENLTRTGDGYVLWRGKVVEHYSHTVENDMRNAALRLADRCLALEQKGFPVNGRSAICPIFEQAPAGTAWLEAIGRFYTFFQAGDRRVAIFYRHGSSEVVVLERTAAGELTQQLVESAYDAFHFVQGQGLTSTSPHVSYDAVVSFLTQAGLTPSDIHEALV